MAQVQPAMVCPSSGPSKIRRRFPSDGLGRSAGSISEIGLGPDQPSRRAAYRNTRFATPMTMTSSTPITQTSAGHKQEVRGRPV